MWGKIMNSQGYDLPIITVKGVSKHYPNDVVALENISFSLEKGEFCFLTGPSGSGKSTLLRLLYCSERPTSGDIFIDGVNVKTIKQTHIPILRRRIGVVFQDFKLLQDRTVFENVALALEVIGFNRDQIALRVNKVLENLGLGGKGKRYPQELSGGEQQRVAIARAIVNRPPIILADEPTGNLDPQRTMEVLDIMDELNARGTTILFATHDERLFEGTMRKVVRLQNGRLEVEYS